MQVKTTPTPAPWFVNERNQDVSQGLIYQEATGKDVAVTYQGYTDAAHIVRCVNHAEERELFLIKLSRSACLDQQLNGQCICFACEAFRLLARATQED